MIYLDYAANTPADPAVLAAFLDTERTYPGNPNASHPAGQAAREALAQVTEAIAARLGVTPPEIIYTSGATESNNLAIKGIAQGARSRGKHILSTVLEHSSVRGSLSALQEQGYEVELVEVDRAGKIDLDRLREKLREDTVLVALSAVDSELGAVQPIRQVGEILADYPNCSLHVDATQAVGKGEMVLEGVDTLSLAPHKFGGLNGSGLLVKRRGLSLQPQIHGGNSATAFRSGTPALALALSMERALALALDHQAQRTAYVGELNRQLRQALGRYPRVRFNSPADGAPHILNLSVQGVMGTVFQRALSDEGVCVSVKSACAEEGTPSQGVLAVTGDRKNALSSWRISLSHLTTQEEVAGFLACFDRCYRALCPAP